MNLTKYQSKGRRVFGKTSQMMEGFYFVLVTSVIVVNRPNTGKDDGDKVVCVTSKNRGLISSLDVYQQTHRKL
jgi:hypothetical protein